MKAATFAQAARLYELTRSAKIERLLVDSPPVAALMASLAELGRATRDVRDDDYWAQGLSHLRGAAFRVRAAPLNTTNPALELLSSLARAEQHFATCSALYPELEEPLRAAISALSDVFHAAIDPLTEAIANARTDNPEGRAAVTLVARNLEPAVQYHLRNSTGESIDALSPRELEKRGPYQELFVVGAPSWYVKRGAGWIFTAPRSLRVWIVGFPPDAARATPPMQALSHSKRAGTSPVPPALPRTVEPPAEMDQDFEIDWKFVSDRVAREVSNGEPDEEIEARLYLLADGWATFLSESDDSRVQTLDPDAPPGERIVSVAPHDLEAGMYVLLRSEGGGDLVVVVADSILGDGAATLRGMQAEWKERLRSLVEEDGYSAVVERLKRAGSNVASTANVAHWCWPRSLRTSDRADFDAIMQITGLGNEADRYWAGMAGLELAHRKAGFAIRDRLEAEAEAADLDTLESAGMADFSLPEGGGALTAYRIEEVAGTTIFVGEQHLGDPVKAGV